MGKQLLVKSRPRFTVTSKSNKTSRQNYTLNRCKQERRKLSNLEVQPNFSPEYLEFKNFNRDAILIPDPSTLFKFNILVTEKNCAFLNFQNGVFLGYPSGETQEECMTVCKYSYVKK